MTAAVEALRSAAMPVKPMTRKGPYEFGIETPVRKSSGAVVRIDVQAGTFTLTWLDERGQPYVDAHVLQFDDIHEDMSSNRETVT